MIESFGILYPGSKNTVVRRMPTPPGRVAIDLFGGGGAIAHYVAKRGFGYGDLDLFSGAKYERVIYNERDPRVAEAFRQALTGEWRRAFPLPKSNEELFAREGDVIAQSICAFVPFIKSHMVRKPSEIPQRINRFKRVEADHLPIEVRVGDYREFAPLRADASIVWFIDPPYRSTMKYGSDSGWDWGWTAEIAGEIVGFDSFLPEGFDLIWRRQDALRSDSDGYPELCFRRKKKGGVDIAPRSLLPVFDP